MFQQEAVPSQCKLRHHSSGCRVYQTDVVSTGYSYINIYWAYVKCIELAYLKPIIIILFHICHFATSFQLTKYTSPKDMCQMMLACSRSISAQFLFLAAIQQYGLNTDKNNSGRSFSVVLMKRCSLNFSLYCLVGEKKKGGQEELLM